MVRAGLGRGLFADVDPNPYEHHIAAGSKPSGGAGHHGMVAFGGGSGLDLGKMAAYLDIDRGFDGFARFAQALNDQLGVPRRLSALGVSADRIDDLATMAIKDPSSAGNPVALTVDNLRRLIADCV